ncbi:hypothetical protein LIER_07007 [Lithospermum erythrorhizon]|uniref:Histone acetyltransferase n=1 Tax=Lithospermum erythrorhizon TaxID=34254 RepID=A0AAV3P8G0_LITER
MFGYREDAYFLLEAYNPHHFSKQLGFSPVIPGFKSRSKDTVLASEGLRYWRSCIATRLGQSVTFPSAAKSMKIAETLKRFNRPDLSNQDEELTPVFSKAYHVRDA